MKVQMRYSESIENCISCKPMQFAFSVSFIPLVFLKNRICYRKRPPSVVVKKKKRFKENTQQIQNMREKEEKRKKQLKKEIVGHNLTINTITSYVDCLNIQIKRLRLLDYFVHKNSTFNINT